MVSVKYHRQQNDNSALLKNQSKAFRYLQIVAGEPSCILWRESDIEIMHPIIVKVNIGSTSKPMKEQFILEI